MTSLSPVSTFNDLNITFHQTSLLFPSQEIPQKSIFLSNIDQILNYSLPTAHFFKQNQDFPFENVVERLKKALEKVLVNYEFMAGRFKLNNKTGRLEIDCNGAGVGFVVASSEFSIDQIGSYLVYPNLGYKQLVGQKLENLAPEVDQPLCFFQVTSFKCGGFAIGICINHMLLDGLAAKTFIQNLASQAFDDKPLAVIPCNDRRLLEARSPPKISFPHPEFLDLHLPVGEGSSPPVFDCGVEELDFIIFKFTPSHISKLKQKATNTTARISSFAVVAAVIWKCKAFSGSTEHDKQSISTLLNVIDIRPRRNPQLPPSYSGNGVLPLGVSATLAELETAPFWEVVGMISEGAKVMTDEYVKSAFDWLEVHRGVPHGDYMVSSWLKLGFDEIEYPWGKPVYSCPVVSHRKDICWVFNDAVEGGVGALVSLPAQEMELFDGHFKELMGGLMNDEWKFVDGGVN